MSLVGKQNSNEVIAYQLRQSFKPGEVTAEEANQIGYQEAGLQPGDTVCIGMSGSFPGLGIASIAAANEMGLNVRVIASYGASMYGATRTTLPIVRILDVARQAGLIEYDMLAVSPGGDFDQGYNLIYPNSREVIFALAREAGLTMIDEETIPASIQRRLAIYGDDVDCFVNVGGASANMGTSPYTLTFPNGLVLDPPAIPANEDRGLTFEYAARHIPVVHLLNVRGLAEENGLPFDPVPLTRPGETDVYYTMRYSPVYAIFALALAARRLLGEGMPKSAEITLFGSFAATGRGHGTDRALIAGLLGYKPDDERIADSYAWAKGYGMDVHFEFSKRAAEHPNTATIKMTGQSGKQMTMTACSLGGGRIMVTEFNGLQAKFSCDLPTLIVQNTDQPGRVGIVTSLLAKEKINIATLHVYRDHPGGNAVMIIEMDKPASKAIVESLSKAEGIKRVITVGGER